MAHVPGTPAAAIYAAATTVRDRCLRGDQAAFTDTELWTPAVLDDLHGRVVGRADLPGSSFDERWSRHLTAAPDPTIQLAAELCYLHVLFPAGMTGRRKRHLVTGTLSWAQVPVSLPAPLAAALDAGLGHTGIAYNARRLAQLRFLLEAVRQLKRYPRPQRDDCLADPWATRAWLAGIPQDGAQSQREALAHLLHPASFEAMVSVRLKREIVTAFRPEVPAAVDDLDRALLCIRAALEPEHGTGFSFLDAPVAERWR